MINIIMKQSVAPEHKYGKNIVSSELRVRVTDRHCHHLRRKIKFGTKNHKLAKTSGEKNIT